MQCVCCGMMMLQDCCAFVANVCVCVRDPFRRTLMNVCEVHVLGVVFMWVYCVCVRACGIGVAVYLSVCLC